MSQNSFQRDRQILLAKVHIAKKDLYLDDALYRDILKTEFGVDSAAKLSNGELEQLVIRFESQGWRAKSGTRTQIEALKERIGQELLHSQFTHRRLKGLVWKICRVDDLRFCHDARLLKRLLVIIGRIKDEYDLKDRGYEPPAGNPDPAYRD